MSALDDSQEKFGPMVLTMGPFAICHGAKCASGSSSRPSNPAEMKTGSGANAISRGTALWTSDLRQ